ncbi:MAG: SH3 domain-containing protein [Chloroflexota bacterium]
MYNTQVDSPSPFWTGLTRLVEGPIGWIVTLILLPCLLIAALMLPPVSLLDRLEAFTLTRIGASGGVITDPDGTFISFPAEGVISPFAAGLTSTPRTDFIEGKGGTEIYNAARELPDHLIPKSPIYHAQVSGTRPESAIITIPIPNESLPYQTLGLYMWSGEEWRHVPNLVLASQDILESRLNFVPDYFMVMQTVPDLPEAGAQIEYGSQLPENAVVASQMISGLLLRGDGALEPPAPPNVGDNTFPIMRNWTGESWAPIVRTDLLNNMLVDIGQQDNQVQAVVETVLLNNYAGAVIDYRGVDAVPSAMGDFVFLMKRIAEQLHQNRKSLIVRVEAPTQISAEEWNTGGFDWRALGTVADRIIVPAPVDPRAYVENGAMDAMMSFATSEIDRRKIQVEFTGQSVERSGQYLLLKGYEQALQPLAKSVRADTGSDQIQLTLDNSDLMSQAVWDEALGMYVYTYQDDQNLERTVYVESELSMAKKLAILAKYNIRKVSLHAPASNDIDPNIWNLLLRFQQNEDLGATVGTGRFDVLFSVFDQNDNLIVQEKRPIDNPMLVFQAPEITDGLSARATILGDGGEPLVQSLSSVLGAVNQIASARSLEVADAGDVSGVASDEGGIELAAVEADGPAEQADEVVAAAAEPAILFPQVSTNQLINVREGPGTNYNILGQITPGNNYPIVNKNPESTWWQIEVAPGENGWVIGQLVSAAGDVNTIAVATDIPPPPVIPTPVPQPEPVAEEQPAPAPVVAAGGSPPPAGGIPFGYGVQAHMVHAGNEGLVMNLTQGMNFNWIKQQIEWKVFEGSQGQIDFGSSDGIVNAANAAGINLLFSIVNAPPWAREAGFDGSVGGPPADPNTFASFNGAMAGKYCGTSVKAIEVWNEQNLHYEWGNKPLNAAEYVALLAPSYAAIKAACPSMWVISGALTPAGNNGNLAMDDFTYFEQMFQAGVNNYADAFGAHPSGYNVPPSKTWQEACEAIQISGNSFNGACDSPHHSWSFRSTMEGYRNITEVYGASNKVIVPTEFGWAAGGAFDPRYAYANDNDYNEQAQWTVEAYQMMRNWGWVGPAILWNLNFRMVANGTEKAQWGIVDPGGSPLPIYNALRDMGR